MPKMYEEAGVDLAAHKGVELVSGCRRQNTTRIGTIVSLLADEQWLHGFGGIRVASQRTDTCAARTTDGLEPGCQACRPAARPHPPVVMRQSDRLCGGMAGNGS